MYQDISDCIDEALDLTKIDAERSLVLDKAVEDISAHLKDETIPSLIFVCTHNSRRSQFSQVWAEVMQAKFGMKDFFYIQSAGTETTECNPRTISSLQRSGFEIGKTSTEENPKYFCKYDDECPAIELWSKTLNATEIKRPLIAVMTCSDADQNCPFVPGAVKRIKLTYSDPKKSDGSSSEQATYDKRSMQIAAEMHYIFERVKQAIG
jgi:arsenate reductase